MPISMPVVIGILMLMGVPQKFGGITVARYLAFVCVTISKAFGEHGHQKAKRGEVSGRVVSHDAKAKNKQARESIISFVPPREFLAPISLTRAECL